MMLRRCLWAVLAVSSLLLVVGDSGASGNRGSALVPSPHYGYPDLIVPGYMLPYGFPYNTPYGFPYVMPYVAPYPAYGILPPPFATWQRYQNYYGYGGGRGTDYTPSNALDYEPRKRMTQNPAEPFGIRSPDEQQIDLRRARFDITVPTADAVVLFDGVRMTQTGTKRVYTTPPLAEGKIYSATFEVSWKDEAGTTLKRKRNFDFVAGERIAHTFGE